MSSRLPETDLANLSFMGQDKKHQFLESFIKPKIIPGSYEPFRKILGDTFNESLPLFGDQEFSPWDEVDKKLKRVCKGNDSLYVMNLAISRATHAYAIENRISAFPIDVVSMSLGGTVRYDFGLPFLVRYPDHVAVVFLDIRRSGNLSPNGRRFIFSAMHERFRVAYPDLSEAHLEIWRFRNNSNREIVKLESSFELITYESLAQDVRETYEILGYVQRGYDDDRRRGTGTAGPLL